MKKQEQRHNYFSKIRNYCLKQKFIIIFTALTWLFFVTLIIADLKVIDIALRTQTMKVNKLVTFYQRELIADTEQYLELLSQYPAVKNYNSDLTECNQFLKQTKSEKLRYQVLAVLNMDGDLVCASQQFNENINSSDRTFFKETLKNKKFSIGDYVIGRISGQPTIMFGYPIVNDSGNMTGVASLSLDLSWFSKMVDFETPPHGLSFLVYDRNSTIIYSYPEKDWAGQDIAGLELYQRSLIDKEGTTWSKGLDGKSRVYSFAPANSENSGMFFATGSETRTIESTIIDVITPKGSIATVLSLLIVIMIWFDLYIIVKYFGQIKRGKGVDH